MTNAFSLPSLFFGIYLIIPMVLGSFLLLGVGANRQALTKAQHLAGILLLLDAFYLIIRTSLIAHSGLHNMVLRPLFLVTDSTMLTIFTLVPYTVVTERYPRWWMYVLAVLPLVLIPVIQYTQLLVLATWSHVLPIIASSTVLVLSIKYARKADAKLDDTFANPEEHQKSWIIVLCACFIVVTIASLLRYLLHGFSWYNLLVNCLWSGLMIAIYVMLVRKKSTDVAAEETGKPEIALAPKQDVLRQETRDRHNDAIARELARCIKEEVYLRGDISIDSLARMCNTNRTYLSTYLREELHQNFYEYINTLRLRHVDELMQKADMSQEVIAIKCGFNSARTMRSAYSKLLGKELAR